MKTPKLGKMVRYTTLEGRIVPALVTAVVNNANACDLTIFYPANAAVDPVPNHPRYDPKLHVYLPGAPGDRGTWHYPKDAA